MTYVPGMGEVPGADAVASGAASAYRCTYTDKLGSVRVVRDENKLQKASYDYDPYGGQYLFSGLPVNHGFTGHTWNPQTALYYAPYRYYSPAAARWLTRDPLGMVDGPNVYGYAGNAPTLYIDPTGLDWGLCQMSCYKKYGEYLEWAEGRIEGWKENADSCLKFCLDDCVRGLVIREHFRPSARCPEEPTVK